MLFNQMCHAVHDMMDAIHHHPFNRELAHGTLPKNKFVFYLEQDALYLAEYFRVLALIGARLTHHDQGRQFVQFALDALNAEKALHRDYLKHYESTPSEMAPTCFMYTNYLLRTASFSSIEEAVASALPCFWVYREVGKKMLTHAKLESHPYQAWISLYASEEFDRSVISAIRIVNHLGEKSSNETRKKMINAFIKATQLEWMFWDAAYCLEKWKVNCHPESVLCSKDLLM